MKDFDTAVIELLWDSLKRDPAHHDRRQTGWGTKTQTGLIACLRSIVEDALAIHPLATPPTAIQPAAIQPAPSPATQPAPLGFILRNGTRVLAKEYKGEASPRTYANRTQANAAALLYGGEVIHPGRAFLVRLPPV